MKALKLFAILLTLQIAAGADAKTSYIFLPDGVEEVEAVSTIDALRRAGMDVVSVAIGDGNIITGATGQGLVADSLISEIDFTDANWLIIPGGMPGAPNLHASQKVNEVIVNHWNNGGNIAAICAGPAVVLAPLGILKDMVATCFPGSEKSLTDAGATYEKSPVVVDGHLITSEGPGTTMEFAKAIIASEMGRKKADEVLSAMLVINNKK